MSQYQEWESEAYVVGAAFIDPSAVEVSGLTPAQFTDPNLRIIFDAQRRLRADGAAIDTAAIIGELGRTKAADHLDMDVIRQAGAEDVAGFVEVCARLTPLADNVEHHGQRVQRAARARAFRDMMQAIPERAMQIMLEGDASDEAINAAADAVTTAMLQFGQGGARKHRHTLGEATIAAVGHVQKLYEAARDPTVVVDIIPWGIEALDSQLPAMEPGNLYGLCARSGEGKTLVAWQIGRRSAILTKRITDYFTVEVDSRDMAKRHLSDAAMVDGRALHSGSLTDGELDRLVEAVRLTNRPNDAVGRLVEIHDAAPMTVEGISSALRMLEATRPDDKTGGLVVIDYWQRLRSTAAPKGLSREQLLNWMAGELKTLSQIIRRPILLLAQFNREAYRGDNGRAGTHQIRESSGLELECTTILGFNWPSKIGLDTPADYSEVYAMKGRTGAEGVIPLKHVGRYQRVEAWSGQKWEPRQQQSKGGRW